MIIRRWSIFIIIGIASASFALVWSVSFNTQTHIEDAIIGQFGDSTLRLATEMATSIEKEIEGVHDKMILMATVPEVRYGDTETCSAALKKMYAQLWDQPGNVGRVGPDGVFYCGVVDTIVGVDANKYPYIQNILNDPEHQPVLSRGVMFAYLDHVRYLTALHVPVFDADDNFTGTLGGAIYFDEIYDKYIRKFAEDEPTAFTYLVDDNGDILYHPNRDFVGRNQNDEYMQLVLKNAAGWQDIAYESEAGKTGVSRYTYEGQTYLAAYVPISVFPGRHWSVVVSTPVFTVQGLLNPLVTDLRYEVLSILIVLILFTVGLLLYSQKQNKLLEEKQKFISTISHQLRTPVTAMRLGVENLLGGVSKRKNLDLMCERVFNINSIVSNLLYFIEGDIKIKPEDKTTFDLSALIENALSHPDLDSKIKNRKIKVTVHGAKTRHIVSANKNTIARVVYYLLHNAADYNRMGGSIRVGISEDAQWVTVSVDDNGLGIPEEEQKNIFKEFFRASNASLGKNEGSGVSLYLANKIISGHKGKIGFQSTENAGSTFWFTIPKKG